MTGVETVIGGAFVSAIIKNVVHSARSYYDKYKLHKDTQEMLDSLEASLPRILWVLKSAEQKPIVKDEILATWMQQLKDVAHEAEDVMDVFETKQTQDILDNKGKVSKIATSFARVVKNLFLSDNDEQNLKDLLGKMKKVCDGIGDLTKFMESGDNSVSDGLIGSSTQETSSVLPKTKKIFGRDKEIELILDMIIREEQDQIESVGKNDVTQSSLTDFNLMKNTSRVIANTPKQTEGNTSEKGKEKAESSSPFRHKFSSINLDRPPVGKRFLSSQNVINISPISDAPSALNLDKPSFGDGQFTDIDKIQIPLGSEKPKLFYLSPQNFSEISISVGDPSIRILPIVGIGGIGKSTVARVIYNHSKVKEYFRLQGWVYVSASRDPQKFVYDILRSFHVGSSKSIPHHFSLSYYHDRLNRAIQHKRFLLVFDDVREGRDWINSTWQELIELLVDGAPGSMIIVTTDSESVATRIGTLPCIFLDRLPPEQFLGLFEYFAFGHNMKKCMCEPMCKNKNHYFPLTQHQETVLKPIGEKIAEKLHGLPIAAQVIGTLLSGKTERADWENILESDWWKLERSEDIVASLGVAFQNLDSDLKQCFIYCSLFPRNYVFDKDKLVQMWIAHGFIHPTEKEMNKLENQEIKIEDIGRSKFDKLVDNFFFQNAMLKNKYVMHDLIREFAIAISSEMLYINGNRLKDNKTIPFRVRHLAIDPNKDDNVYLDHIKWSKRNMKNLRTIMFFGFCKISEDKGIHDVLYKLSGLRLLDISYLVSHISLHDIGKLSHLRFLDLSSSGIREISKSLCNLVHLQVLDIRGCYFFHISDRMTRLINLRHLYTSPDTISLIRGIGKLTNLQELEVFRVKKEEGFTISELTNLKSLNGQLTLADLEKIPSKENAISAKLEDKKYLTSLIFDMGDNSVNFKHHHLEILEGLKPHRHIGELSIKRFWLASFPSWVMKIHEMNKLTSIQLEQCMKLETLPPFGSLPLLEVLNLSGLQSISCIGEEFYGTSDVTFPSLKELSFSYLWQLKCWLDPEKRQLFPSLQKLKITNCSNLSETPLHGLKSSVVELHLSECDTVTKNVESYIAVMNAVTRLYLGGSGGLKLDLHCHHLRELQVLTLERIDIVQFEGEISSLVNLKKLSFFNCRGESSARQQNIHCLPSLASIEVFRCRRIPEVLFQLGKCPSLQTLYIDSYFKDEFTLFEDSWLQQLTSLEVLNLSHCMRLIHLPPSLSTLSSLKKFSLKDCPKIRSLPQKGLPENLKELYIIDCSVELIQACQPNTGAEWSKISHVPYIRVKGRIPRVD